MEAVLYDRFIERRKQGKGVRIYRLVSAEQDKLLTCNSRALVLFAVRYRKHDVANPSHPRG